MPTIDSSRGRLVLVADLITDPSLDALTTSASLTAQGTPEMLAGTLAVAIPTGIDFRSSLPRYPPDNAKTITSDHIAGALHEAVAFGSCALLDDWVELYALWEPRIHEMLRRPEGTRLLNLMAGASTAI